MFIQAKSSEIKQQIDTILDSPPALLKGTLAHQIVRIMPKRETLLRLATKHGAACYVIDQQALNQSLTTFKTTFEHSQKNLAIYYAMKANPHPIIVSAAIRHGYGIDVSSGMELESALKCGARKILFTGPGKTEKELLLAIQHADKVTINVDSFSELEKLARLTKNISHPLKIGIRVYSKVHGSWSKFGIPLQQLKKLWQKAALIPTVQLQGIQFHMSFNETTKAFKTMFQELGTYLSTHFTTRERNSIKYIDYGGGFISYESRGFYPQASIRGKLITAANAYFDKKTKFVEKYYIDKAVTLPMYASEIASYIQRYLKPLIQCDYYCEPGRIIADTVMHLIIRIVDIKEKKYAITDAGTSMMGWKVHSLSYLPVVNLNNPSLQEIPFTLYGSLCTPADVWSRYCYASKIEEGDYLLIPYQGSYSYSFAQNFIKPIPPVILLGQHDNHY